MLIKALNEYYDILSEAGKVCKRGFSKQKADYMIMLRKDGTISDIVDIRLETKPDKKGKTKKVPDTIVLPERTQKPGIESNIIEHRPLYIFGLNYDKKTSTYSSHDGTNKAKKSHSVFVMANLEYTEGMTSDIVSAYRSFIEKWNPEEETENVYLKNIGNNYAASSFCFALDGHPDVKLHDMDGEICAKVMQNLDRNQEDSAEDVCAVSGKYGEIARIHDKIKGIRGAQSSGASMVCFNSTAEESYGKSQSYNSSISQETMKRYTEALNILIADESHRMYMDDMLVIFWAMSKDDTKETDIFASMFNSDKTDAAQTDAILKRALAEMREGRGIDFESLDIDETVEFYVVGLTPNVSRVSQKFIYRDKFGKIFENIAAHQADMYIEGAKGNIPLWLIVNELKSINNKNEKISPPLVAAIFKAALEGSKYPESLLETAVRRIKTDKSITYVRTGIIKACINRKSRIYKNKEELKMGLDVENKDQAYLCGRLFAILERIQKNATAAAKLNQTIKDSYFSAACAKPAAIFPKLMKLSQYHLKKDKYAVNDSIIVGEITDKLGTEFPQMLSLVDQGKFIIGYYHQNQSFYKKQENN